MIETITSAQNARIKHLLALQEKSRLRRSEGLFVVEGVRELGHCIEAGFEVAEVYRCPEICPVLPPCGNARVLEVSREVYSKLAYREGTEGLIAVIKAQPRGLENLNLPADALVVVLESVEKPGNLGAVLRSADAAGVDAVIVCDPLTDLFNPNLIRASIGAIFTVPCAACTTQEAVDFLKGRGIQILTAQLQDSELYYNTDLKRASAIVMGTESTGLSQAWRTAADAHIRIPMLGKLDSLNVSVSAAILMYEAVRQRQE